jgi:hypothetical protein
MTPIFEFLRRAATDLLLPRVLSVMFLPVLGALLSVLHFVPWANIFAPVYMGLAFTHYGLDRLESTRKETST